MVLGHVILPFGDGGNATDHFENPMKTKDYFPEK